MILMIGLFFMNFQSWKVENFTKEILGIEDKPRFPKIFKLS